MLFSRGEQLWPNTACSRYNWQDHSTLQLQCLTALLQHNTVHTDPANRQSGNINVPKQGIEQVDFICLFAAVQYQYSAAPQFHYCIAARLEADKKDMPKLAYGIIALGVKTLQAHARQNRAILTAHRSCRKVIKNQNHKGMVKWKVQCNNHKGHAKRKGIGRSNFHGSKNPVSEPDRLRNVLTPTLHKLFGQVTFLPGKNIGHGIEICWSLLRTCI